MKTLTLRKIPEDVKEILELFQDRPYDNRTIKNDANSTNPVSYSSWWRYPTGSATKSFYSLVRMYGDLVKESKKNPEGVLDYLKAQKDDNDK